VVEDKDRRHNEIWLAAADGSAPAFRYTSPSTEASNPNWSPDGSLLAFSSKREGADDDVWFLRTSAPGGEAFQIRGVHAMPSFSANGQSLAYTWRGDEPDSVKKETWRSRVSPTAITRVPMSSGSTDASTPRSPSSATSAATWRRARPAAPATSTSCRSPAAHRASLRAAI